MGNTSIFDELDRMEDRARNAGTRPADTETVTRHPAKTVAERAENAFETMDRLDHMLAGDPMGKIPGAIDGKLVLEEYRGHLIIENHKTFGDVAVELSGLNAQVLGGIRTGMELISANPQVARFHERVQEVQMNMPTIAGREINGRMTASLTQGSEGSVVLEKNNRHILIESLGNGKMQITMEDPSGGILQGSLPMPAGPEQNTDLAPGNLNMDNSQIKPPAMRN